MLILKNYQALQEVPSVRYVAQSYTDEMKHILAHDVTALRPTSTRLLLSIYKILNFRLFIHDVTHAYTQAKEYLTRTIYLRPKTEDRHLFGVGEDELLKMLKPLYGLCDSGDY